MSCEHYQRRPREHVRGSTPIETRELTADILAREGAIYIPTPNGSPQRTSYNGYDNDAPTHDADYSSSSGDDMKPDEACSDSSSDISIEDTKIDPFKNRRELQDDIAQLESQIHKLRRELALEQVRRPTLYNGSYFARQLDEIRQMIRHWTVTYFTHAGGHWTPSAQRRFERLSEDWAAYLEHEQLRPWLIQARLWHLLQALLFDTMSKKRYSYIFTGRAKNCSFDKMLAEELQKSNPAHRRTCHELRASNFAMLFPGIGHEIRVLPQMQEEIHFRVKQLRRKIWGSLWRYAQQDLPKEDRRNAKAYLEDIVLAAVYFDIDIRKDVAETSFFFRRCHIGDGFDPDLMEEARDGDGEGRVSLIVSPPLQREDYPDDVSRAVLLRKAQVVSGVLERLPRKGYQKFIGPMYTPESSQSKQNHFRHVPRPGLLDNGHATGRANQGSRRSNAGRSRHQSADRVHAPRRSSPDSLRSKRGRSTRRL